MLFRSRENETEVLREVKRRLGQDASGWQSVRERPLVSRKVGCLVREGAGPWPGGLPSQARRVKLCDPKCPGLWSLGFPIGKEKQCYQPASLSGLLGAGGELPRTPGGENIARGQLSITGSADRPWLPAPWLPGASQCIPAARLPCLPEPRGESASEGRAGPELAQQGRLRNAATADG